MADQFPTAGSGMNSRTSCAQRQATAVLAAHSSASSREGASATQNPPIASGYGPSEIVPSVDTTVAFWFSSPPPKTHTPAFIASWATSCAALPTAGMSSSGMWSIAWASNEIRYRVIWKLLVLVLVPGDCFGRIAEATDRPPKTHRPPQIQPHFFRAATRWNVRARLQQPVDDSPASLDRGVDRTPDSI